MEAIYEDGRLTLAKVAAALCEKGLEFAQKGNLAEASHCLGEARGIIKTVAVLGGDLFHLDYFNELVEVLNPYLEEPCRKLDELNQYLTTWANEAYQLRGEVDWRIVFNEEETK